MFVGSVNESQGRDCKDVFLSASVTDDDFVSLKIDAHARRDCSRNFDRGNRHRGIGQAEEHKEGGSAGMVAKNHDIGVYEKGRSY